jgi:hypothetical protein
MSKPSFGSLMKLQANVTSEVALEVASYQDVPIIYVKACKDYVPAGTQMNI